MSEDTTEPKPDPDKIVAINDDVDNADPDSKHKAWLMTMDFVQRFDIELEKEIYYAGEIVTGQVHVVTTENIKVKGIRLVLRGKSHTEWKINKAGERRTVRDDEYYIDSKKILWGRDKNEDGPVPILPRGRHDYPFEFKLPETALPCSFESKIGHVRYYLRIVMDIPYASPPQGIKYFTVIGPHIDCMEDRYLAPKYAEDKYRTCCFCCVKGPVWIHSTLERSAYCSGEHIRVRAEIQNGADENVYLLCKFYQYIDYYINKGVLGLVKTVHHVVLEYQTETVRAHRSEKQDRLQETLQVPVVPPSMYVDYYINKGVLGLVKTVHHVVWEYQTETVRAHRSEKQDRLQETLQVPVVPPSMVHYVDYYINKGVLGFVKTVHHVVWEYQTETVRAHRNEKQDRLQETLQYVDYYINKGVLGLVKTVHHVVWEYQTETVRAHRSEKQDRLQETLQVPVVPPSMVDVCNLMQIRYLLKMLVIGESSGEMIELEFPITIGTVPFRIPNIPPPSLQYEVASDSVEGGKYISSEFQLGQVYMGDEANETDEEILYRPVYSCLPHERKTVTNTSKDSDYKPAQEQSEPSIKEKADVVVRPNLLHPDRGKKGVIIVDEVSQSEQWEVVDLKEAQAHSPGKPVEEKP